VRKVGRHDGNISLLLRGDDWALAPAYDAAHPGVSRDFRRTAAANAAHLQRLAA
jgi:hypothetical protein